MSYPKHTRAITLRESSRAQKPVYHDAVLEKHPIPTLKPGEVLVKIKAAAFNHRDVWIRKGQYPGIVIGSVLGADGAGTVVASSDASDPLLHKRVFLTPFRGWESHPLAPESRFGILGGGALPPKGTFTEYVVVERIKAAIVYANVEAGQHVLITGIGGGVALIAMQICIAKGASVYVTSGNQDKIQKAIALGAKGGANYKDKREKGAELDAVIDSGGGDIMGQISKYLKQGGRVVCYGMTANPKITMTMREVMKNQQLIGSMMGSHKDLVEATKFLAKHRFLPIVSHVLDGLESVEKGFELMKRGDQFGKIVIRLRDVSSKL
ncbi:hypothetical protein BDQ17DRAFT_1342466 [Cyathus striatus]|nr:hypothetical protein BDQ17DRAFT_1342466 [Cyathus striatus]